MHLILSRLQRIFLNWSFHKFLLTEYSIFFRIKFDVLPLKVAKVLNLSQVLIQYPLESALNMMICKTELSFFYYCHAGFSLAS